MRVLQKAKALLRDRRGNFAVLSGLTLAVVAAAAGGALDMAMVARDGARAQAAADAAVIAGSKMLTAGKRDEALLEIQKFATANADGDPLLTLTTTIDDTAGTVSVKASGTYAPAFLPILGFKSMPFSRTSTATVRRTAYMDYAFLFDVSESMNIAADDTERKKLEAISGAYKTKDRWTPYRPCAFACHQAESNWHALSIYEMNERAGSKKAKLRIDVAREAFDSAVDRLIAVGADPSTLIFTRLSTSGFSSTFQKGVERSRDAAAIKNSVRTFSVANYHTNYVKAFAGLTAMLGTQGDGRTQENSKKVAILITDGVKDEEGWILGTINQNECTAIKQKGFQLAVIEIKYVENFDFQGYYQGRVASYYKNITPQLQACASPGLHFLATDAAGTSEALRKLTDTLVRQDMRIAR